ncbi:MAG TPA: Hsp20/alpha crystallin family protein [Sedimenticola sp.]|nr:Hsp20/alpha crystallin family protein [Sedimenticola sp.]
MFGILGDLDDSLFADFRRMQEQMDELFGPDRPPSGIRSAARGSFPPINVGSTPERVDVYLFAAGLDPDKLDVSIQQNLLTIAGERRLPREEDANYFRQERFDGEFRRVLSLPDDVDPGRVDAAYRDGVLHISIHRREAARPRRIAIK